LRATIPAFYTILHNFLYRKEEGCSRRTRWIELRANEKRNWSLYHWN